MILCYYEKILLTIQLKIQYDVQYIPEMAKKYIETYVLLSFLVCTNNFIPLPLLIFIQDINVGT